MLRDAKFQLPSTEVVINEIKFSMELTVFSIQNNTSSPPSHTSIVLEDALASLSNLNTPLIAVTEKVQESPAVSTDEIPTFQEERLFSRSDINSALTTTFVLPPPLASKQAVQQFSPSLLVPPHVVCHGGSSTFVISKMTASTSRSLSDSATYVAAVPTFRSCVSALQHSRYRSPFVGVVSI